MDLLKYLEPMKNLTDSFSNLAFWRGVRKLRDEVVNAFEYVDGWGESVEHDISSLQKTKIVRYASEYIDNLPSVSVIYNLDDHYWRGNVGNISIGKNNNDIVIPLGFTFKAYKTDGTFGTHIFLPFGDCIIDTTPAKTISLSNIHTTNVPYNFNNDPLIAKDIFIYGYGVKFGP